MTDGTAMMIVLRVENVYILPDVGDYVRCCHANEVSRRRVFNLERL